MWLDERTNLILLSLGKGYLSNKSIWIHLEIDRLVLRLAIFVVVDYFFVVFSFLLRPWIKLQLLVHFLVLLHLLLQLLNLVFKVIWWLHLIIVICGAIILL